MSGRNLKSGDSLSLVPVRKVNHEGAISSEPEICQLFDEIQRRGIIVGQSASQCELGVHSCYLQQRISAVAFRSPAALLVLAGRKEMQIGDNRYVARSGEMLMVPADTETWLAKVPDEKTGCYQGLGIRFDLDILDLFQRNYGDSLDSWDVAPKWSVAAPKKLISWLTDWLRWSREYPAARQVQRHRLIEFLLLLAQNGLAGNLLMARNPSWRQRVAQLIRVNPAHEWRISEVCRQIGISESSLRRKLSLEESSFRQILEEARLMAGLSLIQETSLPIGRVADAVGYQSQSRFTERFKLRFDVTPSELRKGSTL